jgi:chemotaxis signal transduction protein
MDDRVRRVLEERTRRYGQRVEAPDPGEPLGSFAGVRFGALVLGLPVDRVHETAPLGRWTPLGGQAFLLGVTQLRGEVMGLVDLPGALGARAPEGRPASAWMAVLQGRGGRAATPVDEVLGTRVVHAPELLPPGEAPALCSGVTGVTRDLWFLLATDALDAALEARAPNSQRPGGAARRA